MNNIFKKLNKPFLKVSISEKILFTKHLSMMTKSGMGTVESVSLIRRQVKGKGFARILDNVIVELENGQSLSAAFTKYKNIFGDLFVSIIALGESSGTLSENLDYLSNELRKNRVLKSKIRAALIYPMIVMTFTIGVVAMLVFFVLPRLTSIFSGLSVELPITTRILMGLSSFAREYYPFIFGGLIFFVVLWTILMKRPWFKYIINRIVLALPVIGPVAKNYNVANIARTLGILLKTGMKIVEAVVTTSDVSSNLVYKKALIEASEGIKRGEPLYSRLAESGNIFPPTLTHMIEVGEKTGNLDTNLLYLAEFYENEVDETVNNLSSIIEPMLLIFMGLIVGFVAVSIITPIYQISSAV